MWGEGGLHMIVLVYTLDSNAKDTSCSHDVSYSASLYHYSFLHSFHIFLQPLCVYAQCAMYHMIMRCACVINVEYNGVVYSI